MRRGDVRRAKLYYLRGRTGKRARIAEKIAETEAESTVGRICIAQVQDHRANDDLLDMTRRIRKQAQEVPISALAMATLLDKNILMEIAGI